MNKSPIITGLLLAMSKCPVKPDAFALNQEAFEVVVAEIHVLLDAAEKRGDLEMAEQFTPVMVDGVLHPALLGIPFMVTEMAIPVPRSDMTIKQPSLN